MSTETKADRSLYPTWRAMKIRCFNPRHHEHHRYGGRGIRIHPPWVSSYGCFARELVAEIGPRPPGLTLDRIDNDGNYEPGNLRWLSRSEQSRRKVHARGEAQGLSVLTDDEVFVIRRVAALKIFDRQQIANWFGIGRSTIGHVIDRRTWRHVP